MLGQPPYQGGSVLQSSAPGAEPHLVWGEEGSARALRLTSLSLQPDPGQYFRRAPGQQDASLCAQRNLLSLLSVIHSPQNPLTFDPPQALEQPHPEFTSRTRPPNTQTQGRSHTWNSGAGGCGGPRLCPGSRLVHEPCRRDVCAGTVVLGTPARRWAWGPAPPGPGCAC